MEDIYLQNNCEYTPLFDSLIFAIISAIFILIFIMAIDCCRRRYDTGNLWVKCI